MSVLGWSWGEQQHLSCSGGSWEAQAALSGGAGAVHTQCSWREMRILVQGSLQGAMEGVQARGEAEQWRVLPAELPAVC